jgi:hypothetical protein
MKRYETLNTTVFKVYVSTWNTTWIDMEAILIDMELRNFACVHYCTQSVVRKLVLNTQRMYAYLL